MHAEEDDNPNQGAMCFALSTAGTRKHKKPSTNVQMNQAIDLGASVSGPRVETPQYPTANKIAVHG